MLVTGVHPLRGYSTWQQFLDAMQEGHLTAFDTEPWAAVSEPCKALLRSILHVRPEERATPAQIMSHEWVAGGGASKELLPHVRHRVRVRVRANTNPHPNPHPNPTLTSPSPSSSPSPSPSPSP